MEQHPELLAHEIPHPRGPFLRVFLPPSLQGSRKMRSDDMLPVMLKNKKRRDPRMHRHGANHYSGRAVIAKDGPKKEPRNPEPCSTHPSSWLDNNFERLKTGENHHRLNRKNTRASWVTLAKKMSHLLSKTKDNTPEQNKNTRKKYDFFY